jgi:N-acetylneuraminate lyase
VNKVTQDKSRTKTKAIQPPRQLIAAVFTPFTPQYEVNLKVIDRYAEFLTKEGVAGVFVCGTTGEGLSLTTQERFEVAERWGRVCGSKMRVFIHVGNECQKDACALATHAQEIGAGAISTIGPNFFKPRNLEELVDHSSAIAAAAPELPFYYYHIPAMTGLSYRMISFLTLAAERIPTLAGIKFTAEDLMDFGLCSQFKRGRFDIVFGRDEILLSALALGARKAIGSTYNFFAPSYLRVIKAFEEGDLASAREEQFYAMKMIQILCRYGAIPAGKAIMNMRGIDCGPVRPPLTLSTSQVSELRRDLDAINFFDHVNTLQKC